MLYLRKNWNKTLKQRRRTNPTFSFPWPFFKYWSCAKDNKTWNWHMRRVSWIISRLELLKDSCFLICILYFILIYLSFGLKDFFNTKWLMISSLWRRVEKIRTSLVGAVEITTSTKYWRLINIIIAIVAGLMLVLLLL